MSPGDPEVADLHVIVLGDQDVSRLDVAVHRAALMGGGQAVGDLGADPGDALGRQRALLGDELRQVARRDVLHHEPVVLAVLDRVVDRDDVAMVERG
jgi:hypothetical protein